MTTAVLAHDTNQVARVRPQTYTPSGPANLTGACHSRRRVSSCAKVRRRLSCTHGRRKISALRGSGGGLFVVVDAVFFFFTFFFGFFVFLFFFFVVAATFGECCGCTAAPEPVLMSPLPSTLTATCFQPRMCVAVGTGAEALAVAPAVVVLAGCLVLRECVVLLARLTPPALNVARRLRNATEVRTSAYLNEPVQFVVYRAWS